MNSNNQYPALNDALDQERARLDSQGANKRVQKDLNENYAPPIENYGQAAPQDYNPGPQTEFNNEAAPQSHPYTQAEAVS